MKFFTSIAPRHFHENRQYECVATWLKHGEVYSINNKHECETLKEIYPFVTFIETTDTHEERFGKPYVGLNAILQAMMEHGGGALINSDIELLMDDYKWAQCMQYYNNPNKFLYLHRYNYSTNKYSAQIYMDGVDMFFLTPKHIEALPKTKYCLGQCYFDVWLPWYLILKGFEATSIKMPIIFHKEHPVQYKHEHWDLMGQYTGRTFMGSKQKSGKITENIYKFIRGNTTYV